MRCTLHSARRSISIQTEGPRRAPPRLDAAGICVCNLPRLAAARPVDRPRRKADLTGDDCSPTGLSSTSAIHGDCRRAFGIHFKRRVDGDGAISTSSNRTSYSSASLCRRALRARAWQAASLLADGQSQLNTRRRPGSPSLSLRVAAKYLGLSDQTLSSHSPPPTPPHIPVPLFLPALSVCFYRCVCGVVLLPRRPCCHGAAENAGNKTSVP